jgi:hypothetical protein
MTGEKVMLNKITSNNSFHFLFNYINQNKVRRYRNSFPFHAIEETKFCLPQKLSNAWHWNKIRNSVHMRDNYSDCPERERGQWWGEEVHVNGHPFYAFDPQQCRGTSRSQ